MPTVKYLRRAGHAGFVVYGDHQVYPLPDDRHADRVLWLIAQIEMPQGWGTVQNYDGAVMSAGLLHNTAILPKRPNAQGSLWRLMRRVLHTEASLELRRAPEYTAMMNRITDRDWVLGIDGKLRYCWGAEVPIAEMAEEITGTARGDVPDPNIFPDGHEYAKTWALMFHALFAHPATYATQIEFALEWLLDQHVRKEAVAYSAATNGTVNDCVTAMHSYGLEPDVDLAMAVYHCFSVNAPSVAAAVLDKALVAQHGRLFNGRHFTARLIRLLGESKYGNWSDNNTNRSRYDRTRLAARKLWAPDLVDELMPENLSKT